MFGCPRGYASLPRYGALYFIKSFKELNTVKVIEGNINSSAGA